MVCVVKLKHFELKKCISVLCTLAERRIVCISCLVDIKSLYRKRLKCSKHAQYSIQLPPNFLRIL